MLEIRQRFFVKSIDGLYFAVTNHNHPENYVVSFLRYMPCKMGTRKLNGVGYKKVSSSEAYSFLKKYHPNYLFKWNIENKDTMGVPVEDIVEILNPIYKLSEIMKSDDSSAFYEKIRLLARTFHNGCDISYDSMGVSGSTLLGLENPEKSDIDFIIYGIDNHRRAIDYFSEVKKSIDNPLNEIDSDYWVQVFNKRIKDDSMTLDEFIWYESRKNNRGLINDTLFDISCSRSDDDGFDEPVCSRVVGRMKIKCKIIDDSFSYDAPAIYDVSEVEILEGPSLNIEEIVSYTHTYAGIVKNNEVVIASGVCEETTYKKNVRKYSLIIGTTRESINEYVKLEENPLNRK